MKSLLLISLVLLLLGSQATLTNFPSGPLESYKDYLRGVCAATGADCDLANVSSCYDDVSASNFFNFMYKTALEAVKSTHKDIGNVFKTIFADNSEKYLKPIMNVIHCEESLPYSHQIYAKINASEHNFESIAADIIHYTSARPEDALIFLKHIAALSIQGNFEALGLTNGNFLSQVEALKHQGDSKHSLNLESYKAYLRGVCAATGADCDLTPVASCYDDASASILLNFMHKTALDAVRSNSRDTGNVLKTVFTENSKQYLKPIMNAIHCEESLPYARQIYAKMSTSEYSFERIVADIIQYASIRPENTFIFLKHMAALFEQGNFEALGLVDGSFESQVAALKRQEDSDWRKNAKNGRRLLLKGICEALALDCPMSSLNCMSEEASAMDLKILYEWAHAVATKPISVGIKDGADYLLGRAKELVNQVPKEDIECDENSTEIRRLNEKIGLDVWSAEWAEAVLGFMKEFPELTWHYKVAEHELFENNDLEGAGMVMALSWHQVSEWKQGKLNYRTRTTTSEL